MKTARFERFIPQIEGSPSRVFVFTSFPFDWIGRAISFFTQSKVCHCGFIFKDENGRLKTFEATFRDGVKEKSATLRFLKRGMPINVFDLQADAEQEEAIMRYCHGVEGQKYDYLGALFGLELERRKKYCSSLVIKALRRAGYLWDFNSTWRTTPADISQLLELKAFR